MGNQKTGIGPCSDSITEEERLFRFLNLVLLGGESKPAAEEAIEKLGKLDDYPAYLTEVLLNPNRPTNVRILASEKLTKFVKAHWCATDESFVLPEINSKNKTKIRELLFAGLSQSTIEVLTAVTDIISTIVQWDWPNDWPGLIDTLVFRLNSENKFSVHGALLVLKKFHIREADTPTLDAVAIISSEMHRIFAGENYSEEIRCLACKIFSEIVSETTQYEEPDIIEHYLLPSLLLFRTTLQPSWTSENCSCRLKVVLLNVFIMWMRDIPKYILDILTDMLPLIQETFIDCAKDYQAFVINGVDGPAETGNYSEDLVKAMLKFIEELLCGEQRYSVDTPEFMLSDDEWSYLQSSFLTPEALRHLIMMVEVTEGEIELWNTDFDDFIDNEDIRNVLYGRIRRKALELIEDAWRDNREVMNSLIVAVMKYLEDENERRIDSGSGSGSNSWKSHEAFLLVFSLMKDCITWKEKGGPPRYDVVPFLENIVLADFNDSASHPLLVGRCLSLVGIYSDQIPIETGSSFLEATVKGLERNQPPCVKMCAAKAVSLWYRPEYVNNFRHENMLLPHISAVFEGLYSLAKDFKCTGVHVLVVEGVASLMQFDQAFTVSAASKIYTLTERAMLKYEVMETTTAWQTVFRELILHGIMYPKCIRLLETRVTKALLKMMGITPPNTCRNDSIAIDIILILVEYSEDPLPSFLVDTLFPTVCDYIVSTYDLLFIRFKGIELIRTYLPFVSTEKIRYKDRKERYGAHYILRVIVHALNHKSSGTTIEELCKILIMLMKQAWDEMREDVDELLKTLLRHMQSSKFICTIHPLLMVYAHLIHKGSDTIFVFLADALSLADQKSFLESVIADGFCKKYHSVDGEERETVRLALGKVLEHGVTNPSSPLHQITLKGSGQPIPLLVRICKLTINEQFPVKPTIDKP